MSNNSLKINIALDHNGMCGKFSRNSKSLNGDDGFLRARHWFKGNIFVTAYERTLGGPINVTFLGRESTYIPSPGCMGACTAGGNEKIIFEKSQMVHDFADDYIEPGTTSYPFSIYLPAHLPPSMQLEDCQDGDCAIYYSIRATLNHVFSERKLTVVGATLSTRVYPYNIEPTRFPLKAMGVRDNGCLMLGAKVDNRHVAKGQTFNVSIACRNQSKLKIKRVDLRLIEAIHWKQGVLEKERTVLLSDNRNVKLQLNKKDYPEQPGRRESLSCEMELATPLNMVSITIPSRARDSYKGDIINVAHYVEIVFVLRDRAANPRLKFPINVFEQPMDMFQMPRFRRRSSNGGSSALEGVPEGKQEMWHDTSSSHTEPDPEAVEVVMAE